VTWRVVSTLKSPHFSRSEPGAVLIQVLALRQGSWRLRELLLYYAKMLNRVHGDQRTEGSSLGSEASSGESCHGNATTYAPTPVAGWNVSPTRQTLLRLQQALAGAGT